MITPILKSDRLILVPLSRNHLSVEYVDWMNDVDVVKYLESGGNYTYEMLSIFLTEQEEKKILFWAIHTKDSNKHIGNIKIDPINKQTQSGEYGIMMGDKINWGKGYATEASNLVIDYCFNKLNFFKITLGVIDINISAIQLYKKLGFVIFDTIKNNKTYNGEKCKILRMHLKKKKKLILGTAQLGLNYGINNTQGKPSLKNAFEILEVAYDNGIVILDTAEAYGNSQEVIGLFHKENPNKKFQVISKIAPSNIVDEITFLSQIKKNCKLLHVDFLYGYMFHHYNSLKENPNIYNSLLNSKEKGLIKKIGISLYTNQEIEDVIDNYSFDIIQIPFNLFDNERLRKKIILKAKARGIEIHTRSAFLQGLFFMDASKIPTKICNLANDLNKIKSLEVKYNLDTVTMALQYVVQKEYIDYAIVGVDSAKQLLTNINIINESNIIPHQEIDAITVTDKTLLNPSNW